MSKLQEANRVWSFDVYKMSVMKKTALLLLVLALASAGCSGSQEIQEPSRDDFISGEVKTMIGPMAEDPSDDEGSE